MEMYFSPLAEKVSKPSRRRLADRRHRPTKGKGQGVSEGLEVVDIASDFVVDTNMVCWDRGALEGLMTDHIKIVHLLADDGCIDDEAMTWIASRVKCRALIILRLVQTCDMSFLSNKYQNVW